MSLDYAECTHQWPIRLATDEEFSIDVRHQVT